MEFSEAESFADVLGPLLEIRCVNFDGRAAEPTRQVVVVGFHHAPPVETLAAIGHNDVNVADLDEFLELGVDGRQSDVAALALDEGVEFLGTDESRDLAQNPDDLSALDGVSRGAHARSLSVSDLLSVIILGSITGMILKRPILVLTVAVASIGIGGVAHASTKPLIVSGVSEWGALAHQLVGSDAMVVSLLTDPNADPHDHEATISDASNVARASVVLVNGAGYDTWLSQLVSARGSKVSVINVGKLMGVAPGKNPHLFYNPLAAIKFVKALTTLLEHQRGYSNINERSGKLLAQLDAIQANVESIATQCHRVKVAATEDVTTYLLKDARLDIVTPEALRLAVGNGVDPSVRDLATALEQLKQHPAFLIDNIQTATPLTNELAAQAKSSHVPIIKVTETMRATNYVGFISGVVGKIRSDLKIEGCLA
jgi:zinc/manganese transport system substrate-binding protein